MARRIIDLTYPIHEGMTTFPSHWHPVVEVTILGRHGIERRETRKIVMGTHTGTHCDAPRHFIPDGPTVDTLSLDTLIGPARVIDFSDSHPLRQIGADDLVRQLGDQRPERVVLRFDWSRHWGLAEYYTSYPFIGEDAAQWLLAGGVRLLGMDTPSPDSPLDCHGSKRDSPIHRLLLANGVVLVEYLCNLDHLRRTDVELLVMPLKIAEGDASPARCVAIESP